MRERFINTRKSLDRTFRNYKPHIGPQQSQIIPAVQIEYGRKVSIASHVNASPNSSVETFPIEIRDAIEGKTRPKTIGEQNSSCEILRTWTLTAQRRSDIDGKNVKYIHFHKNEASVFILKSLNVAVPRISDLPSPRKAAS